MERKLASIQVISALDPIEGADRIERATVLGWQLVVKKGEFSVGDLCVYVEIDSLLSDLPEFEFMRNRNFRVRTIRLKNTLSQGLALPISVLARIGNLLYNNGNIYLEIPDGYLQNNEQKERENLCR